ncbi:MAG: hypothetical protein AAF840_04805, partial [Bacteroidota bacterium]
MKYLSLFLSLLVSSLLVGQSTQIAVEATGCKALYLYAFNGVDFNVVKPLTAAEDGSFHTEFPTPDGPVFRYVGSKPSDVLPVIIGGQDTLRISGTCGRMK